jgi:hypothetical protein
MPADLPCACRSAMGEIDRMKEDILANLFMFAGVAFERFDPR